MVADTIQSDAREKLLDAASSLMLERGYHGAAIGEICERAGQSRNNFDQLLF